jgi:hypothetical protein
VKQIPAVYRSVVLIGPLLVIGALMLAGPLGCGSSSSPTALPTLGSVEVGLVDSPSKAFQAISLNLVQVRLNPSTDSAVADTDPNWEAISAPPASGPGELSVNLLDLQNSAMIFNTGSIASQVYNQIELVVDATLPGVVIPSCASSTSPPLEGCVNYNVSFSGSTNIRFNAAPVGGVSVGPNVLTPIILDVNPGPVVAPAAPGGNYTLTPTITLVTPGVYLTAVAGVVQNGTVSNTVNAELTGTNAVVATAPVESDGSYTIQLPAAPSPGTTYDLFVSGSGLTYDVASDLTVVRGSKALTQDFAVASVGTLAVAGQVIDARSKGALVGATANLLVPEATSDDCTKSLTGCVVVATATTDNTGSYAFSAPTPPTGAPYYVQASTVGTNTVTQLVTVSSGLTVCPAGPNPANCSFLMPNVQLKGTIAIDPAPAAGTNTVVTIMAEQTGTNNLVGLTQVTVSSGSQSFSMEVPATGTPNNFVDLIASANDTYNGLGTQFPGHQIAVAADVDPATASPTLTVNCLGHGTIAGVATSPDLFTHVRLFQDNVILMDSTVGQTLYPTEYSFCTPPNTYTVQRFEEVGNVANPVGPPQQVIVQTPEPTVTSTPCPLCTNEEGACPGNCSATGANPLTP